MDALIFTIVLIIILILLLGILISTCLLIFLAYVRTRNKYENLPTADEDTYGDINLKNVVKKTSVEHSKIVIALDIGTENMGYAFSCTTRKNHIYTAKNSSSPQSNRMPTAVLLNDDLSLKCVGSTAVDCRSELALKTLHAKNLYFRKFRLKVFGKEDEFNCPGSVSGETIVCHVIDVLKSNALETIQDILFREGKYTEDDIEWAFITPNPLTKEAENVILRAARKAKLERINLVPESDAAAWYCLRKQLKISWKNEITNMTKGQKFVVADLGTGKTSICVYEILTNETLLRQFYYSKNIGGNSVNEEFERFMEMICGSNSWNEFRKNHVYDYEELMHLFEKKKVTFDNNTECIALTLPQILLGIIKTIKNGSHEENIEAQGKILDTVGLVQEKLIIYRKQMEKYFMPSLQPILNTLKRIREMFAKGVLSEMLLVGGYSASSFIRKELKETLPSDDSFDIVLVQDPEMVVLKGAVMIGLENRSLDTFKCKQN